MSLWTISVPTPVVVRLADATTRGSLRFRRLRQCAGNSRLRQCGSCCWPRAGSGRVGRVRRTEGVQRQSVLAEAHRTMHRRFGLWTARILGRLVSETEFSDAESAVPNYKPFCACSRLKKIMDRLESQ
jgi:hypothetical protein